MADRSFREATSRERPHQSAADRVLASALVPFLVELSPEQRLRLVRTDPRYRSWALAESLIEESQHAIWSGQPERCEDSAEIAVLVTEHLSESTLGRSALNDVKARAQGCLGNALRTRADFTGAERCFAEARLLLGQGSGDPLESAWLTGLEASLLTARGYLDEAIDLLKTVLPVYDALNEPELRARSEIQMAQALAHGSRDSEAIALLTRAEQVIDRGAEPRLFLFARHSRAVALCHAGRTHEALLLLDSSRDLYLQFPDPWSQLRLRWLEARIAAGLGRTQEAEAMLGRLWTAAFERGLRFEVALISLDLAAIYIQLGRYLEAGQLAGRLISLFESWGVHRRAIQAWVILEHALIAETATVELVRQIAAYVRRGWRNPEIPLPKESPAPVR
ncbi:MAG: hypothetical protein SF066_09040 [Thermoanaerobaculia bacterium]|nr:hypothetical protein [Thermoanaerobaculia bacterium]